MVDESKWPEFLGVQLFRGRNLVIHSFATTRYSGDFVSVAYTWEDGSAIEFKI